MRAPQRLGAAVLSAALAGALLAPTGRALDGPIASSSLAAWGSETTAAATGVAPSPVEPTIREHQVEGISRAGLAVLAPDARTRASSYAALSTPEPASGFAVAGVTWKGPAPRGLTLDVRTLTAGTWSGWAPMDLDADRGPTPGSAEARRTVPGTDPFVVGNVDKIQVRAKSLTGDAPRGLTLSIIDPGRSAADRASDTTSGAASETLTDPLELPNSTPMPTIHSRSDWGADERMRGCCVEYGEVHTGFVHHTVNSNNYTRGEVPAILRGIYAYHTQSRGWRDIGYNFLIDKFGRIWEGRYGGITRPVVGAHTLYYNENSFAASAIGNYQTTRPSAAMLDAFARLYAWKLSLHGVRPNTRQNVAGVMFDAISGHRDAAQTACPGIYLYRRIPEIAEKAQQYQHAYVGRDTHHSFARGPVADVLTVRRLDGRLGLARGTGAPGFDPRQIVTTDFAGRDELAAVGDVTGDGINDVMARTTSTGITQVLSGVGDGTFKAATGSSHKWEDTDLFAGPGDLDEDGRNDLVARDEASGSLVLYRGLTSGGFGAALPAVTAFDTFNLLSGAGDFTADGHIDLISRNNAGRLVVLAGDGAGAFPTRVVLPGKWADKDLISAGVDLTGDGRPDVVARNASTHLTKIFANVDGNRLSPGIGELASPMRSMSLSRDLTGDAEPDLVTATATGVLAIVPARRQNWLTPSRTRAATWTGINRAMVVGDWNSDGYVDAMARDQGSGRMWLYPGRSTGGFGARVGGSKGWGVRSLIAPVGDFDGDGHPDLIAKARNGHVYLYPGRGASGFKNPVIMRSGLPGAVSIATVGLWNGDGAPDVVVKTSSGQLMLYPGNGPGGLGDPAIVHRHADLYDTVVGVGDLTGDGQPDLIGRMPGGDVYLLPGESPTARHPAGSIGPRQYLASGWSSYRLG